MDNAEGERELGVLVGIDAELEAAAARRHHVRAGAILALNNWRRDECVREVGPGWDGDEVAAGAILAVHSLYELLQGVGVGLVLAEADNVDVDLLLLELLGHLDERRLVHVERRPHEHDDASLVVLVLTVLEGQMGDLDALDEFDGPGGLDRVQLGQHFAGVGCEGDEDAQLGEGHQANRRFGVGPQLRLSDEIHGVLLGLQPGGQEVPISHGL